MPTLFFETFDAFTGAGFAAAPGAGQLDSDLWRVTGLSDGNGSFGGTFASGDFARGSSSGGVTTGGVYAFTVGGNTLLGVQPAGSDFTPGTIELLYTNDTGSTVEDLSVVYDLWVNNDQSRGNSFSFSYSTDGVTFVDVPSVSFTSADASDGNGLQLVLDDAVATLTGVTLAANDTLILRWTGDDVSGGGSRDEFAIDDVRIETGDVTPAPAQIVITEIMQNPSAVGDSAGEWFEIFNAGTGTVDINGWTISDNGVDSHVIANGGPLLIEAGDYLVLGNNGDVLTNGGVNVDYVYNGLFLANGDDEVILTDTTATEIDRVEYDGGPAFPDPTGASMALIDPALDNNIGSNWETSTVAYGDGDFGTPGAANDTTPPPSSPLVINEVDADTTGSDTLEFVELYDGGAGNTALDGYVVVFLNGSDDASYEAFDLDGFSTDENGYFVLGNPGVANVDLVFEPGSGGALQNGADAVALFEGDAADFPNDTPVTTANLIDAIVYDTNDGDDAGLLSGLGQSVQYNEDENGGKDTESLSRVPNGTGDFVAKGPTPGAANDAAPLTLISAIQGFGTSSPLAGGTVTVRAVVTGDFQSDGFGVDGDLGGFYLQEEAADSDGNVLSSEGIFVFEGFNPTTDYQKGQILEVTGTVAEFFGETQISASSITIVDAGDNGALVDPGIVSFPTANVVTNSDGELIADLEAYEGMLVTVPQELTVSSLFGFGRFGEVGLHADGRLPIYTQVNDPDVAGFAAYEDLAARNTVFLDDGSTFQNPEDIPFEAGAGGATPGQYDALDELRSGDTITDLTGVVRFSRGSGGSGDEIYRILATDDLTIDNDNPRPEEAPDVGGSLRVASLNVLNYFSTIDAPGVTTDVGQDPRGADDLTGAPGSVSRSTQAQTDPLAEFTRQTEKLVSQIVELDADVLGLVELENSATDAAISALVDAINNSGQTTRVYDYVSTGNVGTDAITVGFIYDTLSVATVGEEAVLDSAAFTDPNGDGTQRNRPAVAQTFEELSSGEKFTAVTNHFKSKGGSGTGGDADIGDGAGAFNDTRTDAAIALAQWLATDPTGAGDEDVLILGDLNAYAMEDPIDALKAAGYTDLVSESADGFAYSYGFPTSLSGASTTQAFGTLDYALANSALLGQVTGAAVYHANADEPGVIDYNLEFKPQGQADDFFNGDDPFRGSDHDAIVVGLNLNTPNSAPMAMNDEGTTDYCEPVVVDLLANDTDPDEGDNLSVIAIDDSGLLGQLADNGDGTITYNPNGAFAYLAAGETAVETFSYTIADDEGETSMAMVSITIEGNADDYNTGSKFAFSQGTNGGANRFGFNGDDYFISGQGVRGRPTFDDFDDFLLATANVFDGVAERTGTINDQRLDDGDGPNNIRTTAENEVVIGGSGIGGSYKFQFEKQAFAENFEAFVEDVLDLIDANNVVATDPEDFRFDIADTRVFFDKENDQFGLTSDNGATQERFTDLESFVEGIVDELGGTQLRDGSFNDEGIANGRTPNVRVQGNDVLKIAGQSVGGNFRFAFDDPALTQDVAAGLDALFDLIDQADAVAIDPMLV